MQISRFSKLLLLVIFVFNINIFGQSFKINVFSKKHYAIVEKIKKDENEYLISIKNTIDHRNIITAKSDSHVMDVELEEIDTLGYQEIILFKDFNFDNNDDFAVQTGYSSKGPSYSIYLFKSGKYLLDNMYTNIIQQSQGNFDLDESTKTINTRGNGGCCWHSFSSYSVRNGVPILLYETIEEVDEAIVTVTTKELKNGKNLISIKKTIDLEKEGIEILMSFNLAKSKKKLVLYNLDDRTLNYVLIQNDNDIEFYYPIEAEYKNPDFSIKSSLFSSELTFYNKGVKYSVYQKKSDNQIIDIGVKVFEKGKLTDIKGDLNTLNGQLNWSELLELDNVYNKK